LAQAYAPLNNTRVSCSFRPPMADSSAGAIAVSMEATKQTMTTPLAGQGATESFEQSSQFLNRSGVEPIQEEEQTFCQKFAVGIVFTVFVLFRAADRAFIYRVSKYLRNPTYNLIQQNLIWPFSIQLMTVGMLLVYIVILRRQGHTEYTWRFFLPGSETASTRGAVPMYLLALFSLGDQLNAAMQAPAIPYISLPVNSVMSNFVLILMVVVATVWLKTSFKQNHYIGCVMILLSVVVTVADKLEANDCSAAALDAANQCVAAGTGDCNLQCLNSYKDASGNFLLLSPAAMAVWYGLLLFSQVPAAISNCFKQKILKGVDLDVCYATWWSGNFQIVWGLLLFWTLWIPYPGVHHLTPGGTFEAIGDTLQCFIGNIPHPGDEACGQEGGPAIKWFGIYLIFNLTFNVCLLWLTKQMSAVWAQIATTLCLALTNIFSQWQFMVGDSAQLMTLCQWLGTLMAAVALWTYNLEAEIIPPMDGEFGPKRARTFGAGVPSDARTSLTESFGFQKTTDKPINVDAKTSDTPLSFVKASFTSGTSFRVGGSEIQTGTPTGGTPGQATF